MTKNKKIDRITSGIVEKIKKQFNPHKVILFGSYAYGKPNRDSEIDSSVWLTPFGAEFRYPGDYPEAHAKLDIAVISKYMFAKSWTEEELKVVKSWVNSNKEQKEIKYFG